MILDNQSDRKS